MNQFDIEIRKWAVEQALGIQPSDWEELLFAADAILTFVTTGEVPEPVDEPEEHAPEALNS